jgi:hypothetical protein
VRAKIQTSQLVNRLESHALGETDLSATQIKAIEVLIRKTLPDLTAVEMTGEDGGPIETVQTIQLVGPDDDSTD